MLGAVTPSARLLLLLLLLRSAVLAGWHSQRAAAPVALRGAACMLCKGYLEPAAAFLWLPLLSSRLALASAGLTPSVGVRI